MFAGRGRQWAIVVAVSATAAAVAAGTSAMASARTTTSGPNTIHEQLSSYNETPLALSTTGEGQFLLRIDRNAQEMSYELSYSALQGDVSQAHIHFGSRAQTGGIVVFLCTNLGNGPAGTQACPTAPATVSGTIHAADVLALAAAQGIAAGEFDEFLAAIDAESTYVNVHSSAFPGGEIRAQLAHGN
jgi:CHRD domain